MPDEVCAYRYLVECNVESGFPGRAEFWLMEAIKREPLLFDKDLIFQIKLEMADSLLNAGNPEQVVEVVDAFLLRTERIGEQRHWQIPEFYLRLGTAYRASDDIDNAVSTWRKGIFSDDAQIYYSAFAKRAMAESLVVYSSTFDNDSLEALFIGDYEYPQYPTGFFTSWIQFLLAILLNGALWFSVGLFIAVPVIIISYQKKSNEVSQVMPEAGMGYFITSYLLYVLLPGSLIPAILMFISGQYPGLEMVLFLISGAGGIVGVVLAVVDSVLRARKGDLSIIASLRSYFVSLWFIVAITLAIGFSLIAGLVGLGFIFYPWYSL